MRLVLLITLTMIAFAANSVLNRLALEAGSVTPAAFAAIRLLAGALTLSALLMARGRAARLVPASVVGPASLLVYVLGFSFAYVTLDAGAGALFLFGGVQVTMFVSAVLSGERIAPQKWAGAGLAFAGLCYLMWPSGGAPVAISGALMMFAAAVGWGIYSLVGRGAQDPLQQTAVNFLWASPIATLVWLVLPEWPSLTGWGLAVLSGAVTSGLGYALWYRVLPEISASTAAVAQLTVPILAVVGGVMFLGEAATVQVLVAAAMVLGGVALSLYRKSGSSAS